MKGFKSFSEEDLTSDCLTSIVILVACVLSVFYLIAEKEEVACCTLTFKRLLVGCRKNPELFLKQSDLRHLEGLWSGHLLEREMYEIVKCLKMYYSKL